MRSSPTSAVRAREPFFTVWPLVAVGLFALNNLWLKSAFPGVVSGKLSDFTACFFLPLYIAALLATARALRLPLRIKCGVAIAVVGFVAVKTSPAASALLDQAVSLGTAWTSLRFHSNRVDASDLWALTMVPLSWLYARPQHRQAHATS